MIFLDALRCQNQQRPPVWLMRQAGRYMPEYRALRAKHSLWELFHQPELAAEVTLLPMQLLNVDAAILFSDILVIAEALGLSVHFPDTGGPFIEPAVQTAADVDKLQLRDISHSLDYVQKTIALVKPAIDVPLIGFCGGPFTIASYMMDKQQVKKWIYSDPASFHRLLDKITVATIAYLRLQIQAGVDAIQIFDSWANVLTHPQFLTFSAAYLKKIVDALRDTNIPIILFCRGSSQRPVELSAIQPAAISFDWQQKLPVLRRSVPSHIAVQGNLDPELLFAPQAIISQTVKHLLKEMQGDPGFIVNLGHGVLPETPIDNVRCLVDTVRSHTE
jgi:uroporphyrinogen decarboxylase